MNRRMMLGAIVFGASAMLLLLAMPRAAAQEVAITFDDLPAHAPMPAGTTRVDVARAILAAFKNAQIPEVARGRPTAGESRLHAHEFFGQFRDRL